MSQWKLIDRTAGLWGLEDAEDHFLVKMKHNGEEYVTVPDGQRLGKQWPEAAKNAEDLNEPTAPAMRGKKKGK